MSTGTTIQLASIFGIILSLYALYVEHKISSGDLNFEALCDLGPYASCSKVLTSASSHLILDIPNAALGLVFYSIAFFYPALRKSISSLPLLFLLANTGSCLMSAYLSTILYEMGDFCILCASCYVVNAIIMICSVIDYRKARKHQAILKKDD